MEVDYKVKFIQKYFGDKAKVSYDENFIDIVLKDSNSNPLLYIESKFEISNKLSLDRARAQIILTNKSQKNILSKVALIYKEKKETGDNDVLDLIHCDDSVLFNNDINWSKEKPSNPSRDAITHINNRLIHKITTYKNEEIKEFYKAFLKGQSEIFITLENVILVFSEWKNSVEFNTNKHGKITNEQDLINLFLVDMLNGKKYKRKFTRDKTNLLGEKEGEVRKDTEYDVIHEGTNLNYYDYIDKKGKRYAIIYDNTDKHEATEIYPIKDLQNYDNFWKKYKRPPDEDEFLKILEHSARLYTDNYRKSTGGEYTPSCFVKLQNTILEEYYHLEEFLVFDPCCGVGNLENDFGRDYKDSCYLSTLEQTDVDTCKIKGFSNVVRFDYLKDNSEPLFYHNGKQRNISEICQIENKKLLVIMNPPYQNKKGLEHNTALEFFNKVLKLHPQAIVFYYMTESFLRSERECYIKSGLRVLSHCFSNAKTTFMLSNWSISQVIFDKDRGEEVNNISFSAKRYEYKEKDDTFNFIKSYTYDLARPCLLDEIDKKIKETQTGMILGDYSYMCASINLTNKLSKNQNNVTVQNLQYCLLSKGLFANTHNKYFERNQYIFKGTLQEIPKELFNDCIAFSLFYKNCAFSNKIVAGGGERVLRNVI